MAAPNHVHPNALRVIAAIISDNVKDVQEALTVEGSWDESYVMLTLNDVGMCIQHFAAANHAMQVAEWILAHPDCNRNATTLDTKWTPAHFAAYNGDETMMSMLRRHECDLDRLDVYDETPCDIAVAVGHQLIVDMLGDSAAAREAAASAAAAREALLREAREFEMQRQEELRAQEAERVKKEQAAARKRDRVRRAKEIRSVLELERLNLIRKWLLAREAFHRDGLSNMEMMFASQIFVAHDLIRTELDTAALLTPAVEPTLDEQDVAAASSKKRPKNVPGKKAAGAKTPAVTPAPASPIPAPGAAASPDDDEDDEEFKLPVFSGVMTKEKKRELAKAKAAIERRKRERDVARREAQERHLNECIDAQNGVLAEEQEMRELLDVDWLMGIARIEQHDVGRDRRHADDFVFHTIDPPCACHAPSCTPGECTWVCCGGRFGAEGCAIVDDTTKPPYHPGRFEHHLEGCECARGEDPGMKFSTASRTERKTRTLVRLDSDDDDDDDEDDMGMDFGMRVVHDATAAHTLAGRAGIRFCNPGGQVWSCCGAVQADSEGCMLHKRFLFEENVLLTPTFTHVGGAYVEQFGRTVISEEGRRVMHATPNFDRATSSRCTVHGDVSAVPDDWALLRRGCSAGVASFEVYVVACPSPQSAEEERMIVGFSVAGAAYPKGKCVGGDVGIGWWANSPHIRGLNVAVEASLTYGPESLVCVVLDRVNSMIAFFANRKLAAATVFHPQADLVPAVSLVAGCGFSVEHVQNRGNASYVSAYMQQKAEDERNTRLYGSTERYRAMFRDKFEIGLRRAGGGGHGSRRMSARGGADGGSDDEDDGRINFDV